MSLKKWPLITLVQCISCVLGTDKQIGPDDHCLASSSRMMLSVNLGTVLSISTSHSCTFFYNLYKVLGSRSFGSNFILHFLLLWLYYLLTLHVHSTHVNE